MSEVSVLHHVPPSALTHHLRLEVGRLHWRLLLRLPVLAQQVVVPPPLGLGAFSPVHSVQVVQLGVGAFKVCDLAG